MLMLAQVLVTFRCFLWLIALHVVLLPSSVSAASVTPAAYVVVGYWYFWILLLSCGACLLWPILMAAHSFPHVPLLCRCVWMHGLACIAHEGVTLADLTEKKKGRFGWFSQSSDTHGKSCGFSLQCSSAVVSLCFCVLFWCSNWLKILTVCSKSL